MKTLRFTALVICLLMCCGLVSRAQAETHGDRQQALAMLQGNMVSHICKDGGQWLTCFSLKAQDCKSISDSFVSACLKREIPGDTSTLSEQETQRLGLNLMRCFNDIFLGKYSGGRIYTPECAEPPAHLR
jgi:hypothetical protein